MNKIAILIPIHFEKINYINNIISSYNLNRKYIDLYFIFSNELEYLLFNKINFYDINIIILPNNIDHILLDNKNIYPIFKKMYGLYYLINNNLKYKYSITIDSEILFLDLHNIYDICDRYCNKKEIYGCDNISNNINNQSLDILKNLLINKSNINKQIDTKIYYWFSDIPIYDMSIVNKYLLDINFKNFDNIINNLIWHSFDYNIYIYYCVLYHNYNIINLQKYNINLNWSLENKLSKDINNILIKNNIIINWQGGDNYIDINQHKIIYHLDRYNKFDINEIYFKLLNKNNNYDLIDNTDIIYFDLYNKHFDNIIDFYDYFDKSYSNMATYDKKNKIGYFKINHNNIYNTNNPKNNYIHNPDFISFIKKNKIKNNALLIPTYINHKSYFFNLLNSINNYIISDYTVNIIFSSCEECYTIMNEYINLFNNDWENIYNKTNIYIFNIDYNNINKFNYQSCKKIFGCDIIEYKNLMILDSDFMFINETNLDHIYDKFKNIIIKNKSIIPLDNQVVINSNNILDTNIDYFPFELPWIIEKNKFKQFYDYLKNINKSIDYLLNSKDIIFEIILYRYYCLKFYNNEYTKIDINHYIKKYDKNFIFDMNINIINDYDIIKKYLFSVAKYNNCKYKNNMNLMIHNDRNI